MSISCSACERVSHDRGPPPQVRRHNCLRPMAAWHHRHGLSLSHLRQRRRYFDGGPAWCLVQCACGDGVTRRRDGLHMYAQHCGERIAKRADDRVVVRPGMSVEPVRRGEEFVCDTGTLMSVSQLPCDGRGHGEG